jgi:HEAT repeat protein
MSRTTRWRLPATVVVLFFVFVLNAVHSVSAQKNAARAKPDVAGVLREFGRDWPEDRTPYRNEKDKESWRTYALSMRRLVAMGEDGVPGLIQGCDDSNFQVRGLSARVLGYLQARRSVPALIELLSDKSAPVALLAADSLGQIQDPRGLAALRAARTS